MKTCATCEHLNTEHMNKCERLIGFHVQFPDMQSCTEHKERQEKKKALFRSAILRQMDGKRKWFAVTSVSSEDDFETCANFVRWVTADDWQNIINGKEVEI